MTSHPLLTRLTAALDKVNPLWAYETLVIISADHGQAVTGQGELDKVLDAALGRAFCPGLPHCSAAPDERDVVTAMNGGMAHVYVRNRATGDWSHEPRPEDVDVAVRTILDHATLKASVELVLRRDLLLGGYKAVKGTLKNDKMLLIQRLDSYRSGDVLVVLKPGHYLADYKADHGGLDDKELNVPLVVAGPGVIPGKQSPTGGVSNTQIAATVYWFLTGREAPEGLEPRLQLE